MPDSTFLDPGLPIHSGCDVKPLIDGAEYAAELTRALDSVGVHDDPDDNDGDYIIIAGWLLRLVDFQGFAGFALDGRNGQIRLIDVLRAKARRGVAVYVLGWISRAIHSNRITRWMAPYGEINESTLETIRVLREDSVLAPGVAMNVLAHPAGAVHPKVVVIGGRTGAWGFTGGIDLCSSRWARVGHAHDYWHDVQVRVRGHGVKPLYDLCQSMWRENADRNVTVRYKGEKMPAWPPDARAMGDFPLAPSSFGANRVQSLTTLPWFNYKPRASWFVYPELSFAPLGRFELERAIRHAVGQAQHYIYLECQSLWSRDMMEWIRDAVNRRWLKVIIMTSGRQDPDDPEFPSGILHNSINLGLLADIENPSRGSWIRMYRRLRPDGSGVVVHSKTMIIDDRWAYIGSNNVARRSLATDFEHAYSFTDDGTGLVKDYRKRLWADHFMRSDSDSLDDLDTALALWHNLSDPSVPSTRPSHIREVPLPLPEEPMSSREQNRYDTWYDPDSREPWGVM